VTIIGGNNDTKANPNANQQAQERIEEAFKDDKAAEAVFKNAEDVVRLRQQEYDWRIAYYKNLVGDVSAMRQYYVFLMKE
jgi:hypothetical protein